MAPQYETKGINPLGLVRKLCCSTTSYFNRKLHTGIGLHGDDIFSSISLGGINGSRGPSTRGFLPMEVWLTSARPLSSSQPRPWTWTEVYRRADVDADAQSLDDRELQRDETNIQRWR